MSNAPIIAAALAGSLSVLYAMDGANRAQEAEDVQFDAQIGDDLSAAADALSTFLAPRQAYYTTQFTLKAGGVGTIAWSTITAAVPDAPSATNRLGQSLSVVLLGKTGFDMDGNGIACESDPAEPCPIDAYVVTSGGSTVPDARLAAIANRVTQSRGGGVYDVIGKVSSTAPHDYAGSDAWAVPRGAFGAAPWPTPGHPVARVVIGGANTDITTPSRYPHPTRNKWHASQDFAGCDDPSTPAVETTAGCKITNAGDVTLATGQSLAGAVFKPYPAADGAVLTKPTCPTGTSPQAVTALERAVPDSLGTPNAGPRSWLEDTSATTWTARIRFATQNGEIAPSDPSYARLSVFPYCS
ncbi:hypothetical protein [Azospirillum canadense]|uniref:hypothetical protein n=1 Tax=Azospirillum canadense TaxID=403962 RepID=UPI0022274F16|nr:hypothetical protein [Azospirillum canadense]MCW2240774.1 hypothetical protein [Azospirillum canadense]